MKLDRFINRPVLSTVISILIVILGFLGLISLPVTQYPDIAPPTVSVRATYTGANAQTVLNSVIAPLEDQINGVENMMYMSSNASNNGSADISIYFKQGTDPDMAAVNLQYHVTIGPRWNGGCQCAEPCIYGTRFVARRGNADWCDDPETSELNVVGFLRIRGR